MAAIRPATFSGRITEGHELDHLNPKVAVIMIGTNNTGGHSAQQIAGSVQAIVEELKRQKPSMKILLLAVFHAAAVTTLNGPFGACNR